MSGETDPLTIFRSLMTDMIYSWVFGQSRQEDRKRFQKTQGRIKVRKREKREEKERRQRLNN